MNLVATVRLLVALARTLNISPSSLAGMYLDADGCQEYLDEVIRIQQDMKPLDGIANDSYRLN